MQETPVKVSLQIDRIVDQLNTHWDLQIPRLHGIKANKAADSLELTRKCASRIRALCWKSDLVDSVIKDFEERASQLHSNWVYKRQQVPGTLPTLPAAQSFLRRHATAKTRANPQRRTALLELLGELLDDEWTLLQESDVYTRTSFTSANTSFQSTTSINSDVEPIKLKNHYSASKVMTRPKSSKSLGSTKGPASTTPARSLRTSTSTSSVKREAAESLTGSTSPKKIKADKRQLTLSQIARRQSSRSSHSVDIDHAISPTASTAHRVLRSADIPPALTTSFESRVSEKPASIFSNSEGDNHSNDTSFSTEHGCGETESYFSGGTQLDEAFDYDRNLQKSFERASAPQTSALQLLETLSSSGPFKPVIQDLAEDTPFWYTFELHRLAKHVDLEVNQAQSEIRSRTSKSSPGFAEYWNAARALCKEQNASPLQKSKLENWTLENGKYVNKEKGQSTYFSARLNFPESGKLPLVRGLFELQYMPAEIDKSCRFHRKYGADRFMVLDIPVLAPNHSKSLPKEVKDKFSPNQVHDKVYSWLSQNELHATGRIWRAFYVEPKASKKRKRTEEGMRMKVHLFAVAGLGICDRMEIENTPLHKAVSLLQFINWHTPWSSNLQSTDLKLFARLHLGLSKTTATIELYPSEFIQSEDAIGELSHDGRVGPKVMSDGCARISYPLAMAVWEQMGQSGQLPAAFQARISGAKGLWLVDYHNSYSNRVDKAGRGYWIEVSDSQLKIKPHPAQREEADEFQRTFEVVKTSRTCKPASLNTQVISILENRGVPRLVLQEAMLEELESYYSSLLAALENLDDAADLRAWRQTFHRTRSDSALLLWCGQALDDLEDELDMLLEAGFTAVPGSYLRREVLKNLVSRYIQDRKDKLWIRLPSSTNVFCVPDFQGVLDQNEVQLNLSEPISGFADLENLDALVMRNPAHLPSDIQKVRLVHYPELRCLKNVIIFSTKGQTPLADKLSGGDYDGDTVTVIWDSRLTQTFANARPPRNIGKAACGVISCTQLVEGYAERTELNDSILNKYLLKCCSFNGLGSRLGEVTKFLEKLDYQDPKHKDSSSAALLAKLAGLLVDAPKQGDLLRSEQWMNLRRCIANKYNFNLNDSPAYDGDDAQKCLRDSNGDCKNIIDFLKFQVAETKCEEILADFSSRADTVPVKDTDLTKPFDDEWKRVQSLKGDDKAAAKECLNDLKARVQLVHDSWMIRNSQRSRGTESRFIPPSAPTQSSQKYSHLLEELSREITAIEPLDNGTAIRQDFDRHGSGMGRPWSLLRASCVYSESWRSKFPWKMVAEELCNIKANAHRDRGARVRPICESTRNFMKLNTKKRAAFVARRHEDYGSDDEDYGSEA